MMILNDAQDHQALQLSRNRGIKFVNQNICGLLNKILRLETFVSDTLWKIDIISLSRDA